MGVLRPAARWLLLAIASFALSACKGGTTKMARGCDYELELLFASGDVMNPGDQGEPLPVDIRIYQLRDRTRMDAAEFQAIWKEDDRVLGSELIDKKIVTLYPGTSLETRFLPKPETLYVGVVAIFRHPTARTWVRLYRLPRGERKYFKDVDPDR